MSKRRVLPTLSSSSRETAVKKIGSGALAREARLRSTTGK